MTQKVCIVGGGATGVSLLWCLAQDSVASQNWEVTLIHDQKELGGHSLAFPIERKGKKTLHIDIGVQFISPMLYPNVHEMLKRPEFKSRVPVFDYDSLKIACAFPRDASGKPLNWGNFPAYQQGDNFALYSPEMADDAELFEAFLELSLVTGWGGKSLQSYFDDPPGPLKYQDQQRFIDYLLKPYLSIINGYGAALMDQTTFGDMFPIFADIPFTKTPLGSFTQPGTGWQRFTNGASSWVRAMADVAGQTTTPRIILDSKATAVWTEMTNGSKVHVQWQDADGNESEDIFDKVVLTTDMWTNADLLCNDKNSELWNELYVNYIDKKLWPLMPGKCYIHTDESMLSPDLREQEETLQFNAYYAPGTADGNYDLSKSFTTYIQKNVLDDPDADGYYLSMYGYIPDAAAGDKVPCKDKVLFEEKWTHGKWTPSFMGGAKKNLHLAQGLGNVSYPGQKDSNVYFAGNNTTTDSEEGALDSAMIMADYAFDVSYPMGANPVAFAMFFIYQHEVMFPGQDAASKLAHVQRLLGGLEGNIAS